MSSIYKFLERLLYTLSILCLISLSSFSQDTLKLIPAITWDKYALCEGETATLTIINCTTIYGNGYAKITTEDIRYDLKNCGVTGCTAVNNVIPDVIGDGVVSKEVTVRRGCGDPYIESTIVIKVKPSVTTKYRVSWIIKFSYGNDPGGCGPEKVYQVQAYDGSIEIPVIQKDAPVLTPASIELNQFDNSKFVTATADFITNDRTFRWFSTVCGKEEVETYKGYTGNKSTHGITVNNFPVSNLRAQKIDYGCESEISSPVKITVRPCGQSTTGCNLDIIKEIEDNSCNLSGTRPPDYHSYKTQKIVCTGNCDLNNYWNAYKSDIKNQIITQTDQYGSAGPSLEKYIGPIINRALFPEGKHSGAMTDDCTPIKLPRPYSFAVTLGRFSKDLRIRAFSTLLSLAGPGIVSNFDPVFIRISENSKCVTNYTLPGHVFYPGKVTRCLVKECDSIKILTFGEGTTIFNNTWADNSLGVAWKYLNEHWGKSMFENVDERAASYLQKNHRQESAKTRDTNYLGSLNKFFFYKQWRVKDFKIKYPDNDSNFTLYTQGDTIDFWKMSKIKMSFLDNGTYTATSVVESSISGTWSYDSSASNLKMDTLSSSIRLSDNGFILAGITNVFDDTTLSTAEYYLSFEEIPNSATWLGTLSSAWDTPGNWSNGKIPDETTDVIISEVTPYYPVIYFPAKCKSLKILNNRFIQVNNNLLLTGQVHPSSP